MTDRSFAEGLDAIEKLMSSQFVSMKLRADGQGHTMTIAQDVIGRMAFGHQMYGLRVDLASQPLGGVGIFHPQSGSATFRGHGAQRQGGPGEPFLAVQADEEFTAAIDHLEGDFMIFDPGLLSDVAGTGSGEHDHPVRLTGHRPMDDRATAVWARTVRYLRDLADVADGAPLAPLLAAQAEQLLAAAAVTTFPSNAVLEPTPVDRNDAHPANLRRAIAYIEAHPHQALTVADIARSALITPRALQMAFRRHLDTTPMAFLRRTRLDLAHRDLQAADPRSTTVTAVAARWGFSASQFPALYRAEYGRPPHQTLHGATEEHLPSGTAPGS